MIAHRIASIMTAGLLLGSATIALANKPAACTFSPRQHQAEFNHLPKEKQVAVKGDFKAGCMRSHKLNAVIAAKHAMLDAVMQQPKINKDKVKSLVKEITHLKNRQLKTITSTNLKIAQESGIHLGLPKALPPHVIDMTVVTAHPVITVKR
jgi:hypothetical protein